MAPPSAAAARPAWATGPPASPTTLRQTTSLGRGAPIRPLWSTPKRQAVSLSCAKNCPMGRAPRRPRPARRQPGGNPAVSCTLRHCHSNTIAVARFVHTPRLIEKSHSRAGEQGEPGYRWMGGSDEANSRWAPPGQWAQSLLAGAAWHLRRNAEQCARHLQAAWQQHSQRVQHRGRVSQKPAIPAAAAILPHKAVGSTGAGMLAAGVVSGRVLRDDVGRATWIFLHTLAAQYPDAPSRQQQQDVRNLVSSA